MLSFVAHQKVQFQLSITVLKLPDKVENDNSKLMFELKRIYSAVRSNNISNTNKRFNVVDEIALF